MRQNSKILALLASLALIAAACGGGSDASSDGNAADDVDEPTAAAAGGEPDDEQSDDSETTDDPVESDDPVELTDSFRGVTADTIKIGIVVIDVEVVGIDNGDVEAKWQTAIDAVNADGGVLGRMLEPVFAKYSPLGDTESEAACVKLTQDEEVFAAMGPLFSNLTCFTDVNDTIFINSFGVSQEQFDRSTAVVLGPGALPSREAGTKVASLVAAGALDGSVAIHSSADAGGELDIWRDALAAEGVTIVTETQSTVGGDDIVASEAEMQAFSQVWESEGADTVLAIGAGSGLNVVGGIDRGAFRPTLLLTNSSDFNPDLYRALGYTTDALAGAIALGFTDNDDYARSGGAGVGECIDRFEAASGETVVVDPEQGEVVNVNTTIWSCQAIDIFSQVAAAAGADLTNDSFRTAAENFGPIEITGAVAASIGVDKFDFGDDEPLLLIYDEAADDFVPLG